MGAANASNPGLNAVYAPDALGRLILRQTSALPGGTATLTYMSGDGIHGQDVMDRLYTNHYGATTWQTYLGERQYVPGPNPDERIGFIDVTNGFFSPHVNMQGTLIALGTNTGGPVLKLATGPWGESTAAVAQGTGAAAYPYRYTGQRQDVFANLYDYKARSYLPGMGRFLQPDPTGAAAGPNLYAYADDDPLNKTDPTGNQVAAAAAAGCAADAETVCVPGAIVGAAIAGCAMSSGCRDAVAGAWNGIFHNDQAKPDAPSAPPANNGDSKPHGSPEHNEAVDKEVQKMKDQNYGDIRKNQTQVDAQGNKVGNNKPDVQGTNPNTGQREHVEVDRDPNRGVQHEQDIKRNDPSAKCTLLSCP